VDQTRYVCEIGCGYGHNLKAVEGLGFKKIIGVENSKVRSEITRDVHNLEVLTGSFEHPSIQSELQKRAPFGLIFTNHVVEHVYDPAEIIALSSKLQKGGDYFVIAIPNVLHESPMHLAFFLPHLHSFSVESLKALLNKHGYTVIDDTFTTKFELYMVAQKNHDSNSPIKKRGASQHESVDYFGKTVQRFIDGMRLSKEYRVPTRYLWWFRGGNISKQSWYFLNPFMPPLYFKVLSRIFRYRYNRPQGKMCMCIVNNLAHRYTSFDESPIEIQFEGNINLFYK